MGSMQACDRRAQWAPPLLPHGVWMAPQTLTPRLRHFCQPNKSATLSAPRHTLPLQAIAPAWKERVRFEKIDTEANPAVADAFQVHKLPTLILFRWDF